MAGIGFTFVSGHPEIGLPLVAAGELAWLGLVGTHPAFQNYIDIQENNARQARMAVSAAERMRRILKTLPRGPAQRFRKLMRQCEELRSITQDYRSAQAAESHVENLAELQLDGLDRLLWLFLRFLYTEHSLNRFFETTTIDRIEKEIHRVEKRLEREQARPQTAQRQRIAATLQDNLATCRERKTNLEQAHDSYELVKAEQQRPENKICSLAETGMSRGDAAMLSIQVGSVTGSISETERTLSDLQFVTGLDHTDETVPSIMRRQTVVQ